MSRPTPGRARRTVFVVFATLGVFVGLVGAFLMIAYWSVPQWQARLEPLLAVPPDETLPIWAGVLGGEAALVLLAWFFSFDTRAARRPRLGMTLVLISAGLLLGSAAVGPPVLFSKSIAFTPLGMGIIVGGALLLVIVWRVIEAILQLIFTVLARGADNKKRTGRSLFFSRLLLLFVPGSRETLRSIALDRFQKGDRSERTQHDLQTFFEEGDGSEELVDALCRLSAEKRDTAGYLFYLTRLHDLRPEDIHLTEALIGENLAQGNHQDARRLVEAQGVGDSVSERDRYARILIATDEVDRAVAIAREISEEEGIPFTVSAEILRRALEVQPNLYPAMNLLGEQATASGNLERAVRRFEDSLKIEANQPRVKRQLLALFRDAHLTEPMEGLLAELAGNAETVEDLSLAKEYADVLVANKKTPKARDYLAKLHSRHPKDFEILDRLADALCALEDWKEAAEINGQTLELAKEEEAKARARSRSARIERAQLTAEVYDLQQEVEANPRDVDLALQLVARFAEAGQFERAINQADGVLHRVPASRPKVKECLRELGLRPEGPFILLSFLADLLLEDHEYDAAMELIEALRVRSLTPDAVEADLCQRTLQRVPNHLDALRRMGEISRREHRFSDMVHYFVLYTVQGGEPSDEISRFLFEAYENLHDYKNARAYGKPLVEAHPEDDGIAVRLAKLAFKAKQYDEALEFAHTAQERNEQNFETKRLIATIDRIRRESLSAELQKKLDDGEADLDDIETLADLYQSLEEIDKTIPLYQRVARDPERTVRAKAKLALCLAQKGLYDLADETLADLQIPTDSKETPLILDLLYKIAGEFEAERMVERAGRVYKTVFLVDAGYRDVVRKVEKYA